MGASTWCRESAVPRIFDQDPAAWDRLNASDLAMEAAEDAAEKARADRYRTRLRGIDADHDADMPRLNVFTGQEQE